MKNLFEKMKNLFEKMKNLFERIKFFVSDAKQKDKLMTEKIIELEQSLITIQKLNELLSYSRNILFDRIDEREKNRLVIDHLKAIIAGTQDSKCRYPH